MSAVLDEENAKLFDDKITDVKEIMISVVSLMDINLYFTCVLICLAVFWIGLDLYKMRILHQQKINRDAMVGTCDEKILVITPCNYTHEI